MAGLSVKRTPKPGGRDGWSHLLAAAFTELGKWRKALSRKHFRSACSETADSSWGMHLSGADLVVGYAPKSPSLLARGFPC